MNRKIKKILMIDDEQSLLEIVDILLTSNGYSVQTALDGELGLNMAKNSIPDVIILDVMMPKMSGYMVARLLSEDPYLKDVPIILLTAAAQVAGNIPISVSATLKLSKPFEPEVLLDSLRKIELKMLVSQPH